MNLLLVMRIFLFGLALGCICSSASAFEISAVGDIYLSQRLIDQHISDLHNISLSGDIVFANFEGVLSKSHTHDDILKLKLTMPHGAIDTIKKIGINSLSLANNHSMDLGPEAYRNTLLELKNDGFNVAGLNDNGTVIRVGNLKVRLIAFSFTGENNVNDLERAAYLIRTFKENIIVVSAHMGGEGRKEYLVPDKMEFYDNEQRGNVRKFAHTCIDAGADLVIGHGPHILREMELYKSKLIIYSLGNFIFDYPGAEKHKSTPSCSVDISLKPDGSFLRARINSYVLRYGIPAIDKSNAACSFIRQLVASSKSNLIIDEDCIIK